MARSKRPRTLVKRTLLALFLVAVFAAVSWDDSGGGTKYLGVDLAVGVGTTALIFSCWWLVKRSLVSARKTLGDGLRGALALERTEGRPSRSTLPERASGAATAPVVPGPPSRPSPASPTGPTSSTPSAPAINVLAGRAGRFVGTVRRAYREGRTGSG
ncbi:MAG TPA: hypothetical protein VL984_10060 [Acidimicrobiales bacterium]|nr:hypothetical protein [Acidimicrobiales bacterium]